MVGSLTTRLTCRLFRAQKIQVGTQVSGQYVLGVETSPAPFGQWRRGKLGSASLHLRGLHEKVDPSVRHAQFNEIAVLNKSQWSTHCGFWRTMQDHGPEGRAAHAGIGNPQHLPDSRPDQIAWDGEGPGFWHPGPDRSGIAQHQYVLGCDPQSGVVYPPGSIFCGFEDHGGSPVVLDAGRRGLDHGALGRKRTPENDQRSSGSQWLFQPVNHLLPVSRLLDLFRGPRSAAGPSRREWSCPATAPEP